MKAMPLWTTFSSFLFITQTLFALTQAFQGSCLHILSHKSRSTGLSAASSFSLHHNENETKSACTNQRQGRRALLKSLAFVPLITIAQSSSAAMYSAAVEDHPDLEYLEPVYELELSVRSLQDALKDPKNYPAIRQELMKFFAGGNFSQRNQYYNLSMDYISRIQYAEDEISELIRIDKETRRSSIEGCLKRMEALIKELEKENPQKSLVDSSVNMALVDLERWFDLVPPQDRRAIADLFRDARKADRNRDGLLDDTELASLNPEEREIWRKRIKLVGG